MKPNSEVYLRNNDKADRIKSELQDTPEKKAIFLEESRKYTNKSLKDFVKNSTVEEFIVEYKNRLYQIFS